ncbi:GNAT family N-acetyltransferase [Photobacterium sp. J15]|uniref:GNAT family N-acetyltransferase n=1 Tax=Photobacterium sp. J15 TaxID=265901 RepID=UPI0007E30261|nr:N-acetyltransferase [Photobacterium sp. J15]
MKLSIYNSSQKEEIKQLFCNTFSDSEGETEGKLIGDLAYDLIDITDSNDLFIFVATENKKIIGSIIFSRLTFETQISAFLLGPVAVQTAKHGKGVGQALINFGLQTLKDHGVQLAFTYGDPNFYSKVGFAHVSEEQIKAPLALTYPEGWLAQSLVSEKVAPIKGNSSCVEAISKPVYW